MDDFRDFVVEAYFEHEGVFQLAIFRCFGGKSEYQSPQRNRPFLFTEGVMSAATTVLQSQKIMPSSVLTQALFLDVFPQLSPTQVGETLSFSKKILEFFRKFLEFIQKNGNFFQNSLNFPNFKLCLVEKLKFGQIFVQNISISGLF